MFQFRIFFGFFECLVFYPPISLGTFLKSLLFFFRLPLASSCLCQWQWLFCMTAIKARVRRFLFLCYCTLLSFLCGEDQCRKVITVRPQWSNPLSGVLEWLKSISDFVSPNEKRWKKVHSEGMVSNRGKTLKTYPNKIFEDFGLLYFLIWFVVVCSNLPLFKMLLLIVLQPLLCHKLHIAP